MDERLFCVREAIKRLTLEIIDLEWEDQDTSVKRQELNRLLQLDKEGVVYEPKH